MKRLVLALLLTAGLLSVHPSSATASPDIAPGLGRATTCQPKATLRAAREVVLLVHGTGEKRDETWSWSYEPSLRGEGFATCSVQLPDHGLGDFDTAAEYVVAAIRKTARLADRPIAVIGHSQGGALPVWTTKFWDDLDPLVTDVVSLAGPMDGTQLANEYCTPGQCAPLTWQLRHGSNHVAALRNAPLPAGVDVTSISSQYDEIVRPQPSASTLPGATNVLLQDVCAHDPSEHGLILGDPLAFALAVDAITHDGGARPSRLAADICQQTFIPHGDLLGGYVFLQGVGRFFTGLSDPSRWVDREPPVPAYARPYVD